MLSIIKYLLGLSCLINISFASLEFCSESQEKLSKNSKKEVLQDAFICFTNETGYSAPFPITLVLEVYIQNFIKVDEDLNSISIQAELWTYWTDPGLHLNKG